MKNELFKNSYGNYNGIRIIPPGFITKVILKIKHYLWCKRNKPIFMKYAKFLKENQQEMSLNQKLKFIYK